MQSRKATKQLFSPTFSVVIDVFKESSPNTGLVKRPGTTRGSQQGTTPPGP